MLLSRFFAIVLSIACVVAAAAALLAQGMFNRQYDAHLEDALRRDRFEIEAVLKLEARTRIDAIAPIAASPDVRQALRAATTRGADDAKLRELNGRLKETLRGLNRQLDELSGDLLVAVDAEGVIVAQLGPNEAKFGGGLGTLPVVARALAGYVRDDTWVYDNQLYRVAARPVIDSGQYVGAIVHGKRFDDALAERLSQRVAGASVVFFVQTSVVAAHRPSDVADAPERNDLAVPLAEVLRDEKLRAGERTDPVDLAGKARAVYSLVTGTAGEQSAGYGIARARTALASPLELFSKAADADMEALPRGALGGAAVLLVALAMLFIFLERDRPLLRFARAAKSLANKETERLKAADFGGTLRAIATHLNEALEKASADGSASKKKAADLDAILGAPPAPSPQFFGFAEPNAPPPDIGGIPSLVPEPLPSMPPAPKPPPAPAVAPAPPTPPVATKPAPKPPAAAPPKPPTTFQLPRPGATARADDAFAPAPMMTAPSMPSPEGTATPPAPGPIPSEIPTQLATPGAGVPQFPDEEESRTMVTAVPEELLQASSGRAFAMGPQRDEEEAHFREVYDQFISTKLQCGESVSGLTYPKFVTTLQKNKEQIVQRHGVKKVRFTVYVKDGKAALKATPVKDG